MESSIQANVKPLIVLSLIGFLSVWVWFIWIGGKSSEEDWFERNMMMWGHATGVAAMGTAGSWAVTIACFAIVAVMWSVAWMAKGWLPGRELKKYR